MPSRSSSGVSYAATRTSDVIMKAAITRMPTNQAASGRAGLNARITIIAAANVGMMTEFQTEAAIGSCSVPGWNPFSCALVWDRASMTATSVIDITNPSSPSFVSLEEISSDGLAEFRPALYYESSTQQSLAYYGRPYLLPSSGRLTMRRSRSPASTFEFRVAVRDVYGRAVNQAQIVTTVAPYGP